MQPMTAKYVARSIQNDRLAAANRDRLLRGQAGPSDPMHAGLRGALANVFGVVVARVTTATPR